GPACSAPPRSWPHEQSCASAILTIYSMRSYFGRPGQEPIDSVTFATGVLRVIQREVREQIERLGFSAAERIKLLELRLGDPARPAIGRALPAYVNGGEWKVKCECGGVEYADLELRLFMCCSCWNAVDGHAWRPVL